ncbi:MAG: endonuclease/exonuclease/phosphatase family protein, partial [Paramuribaculum sp.]|nr:endonuclease/exonuclease/phosphatase family protein [Paramuribaculum sp.]
MKKLVLSVAVSLAGFFSAQGASPVCSQSTDTVYGIAFYNLENLFDTINANGKFDLEFSPMGARKWNTEKYNLKLNNLANAIAGLVSDLTPGGPAVIGIAEVE